jgi:hypothetical protein
MEIWNEFARWNREVFPTLPEEERLFASTVNGRQTHLLKQASCRHNRLAA